MVDDIFKDPRIREKIQSSGFGEVLQAFDAYLRSRGYASKTVGFYEEGAVHFALWVGRRKLTASEITSELVAHFLSHHLVRCRCALPGVRGHHIVRAALRHFEIVLEAGRYRRRQREPEPTVLDREIQRFDEHLRVTCGLREATRIYRRRYVCEFLRRSFGDGPIKVARLTPHDVIAFVSKRAADFTPGSAQALASSIRSYFRFLRLCGECGEALVLAVPSVADRKLARLPRVLTDEEASRLLDAFDRNTATGRRDYAIARCLTDLGLRAGEVAQLSLGDINWRRGILRIVGGKSRRDDELPLPASVGKAIAAYLHRGRPEGPARQVFLRVRPPVGQSMTPRTVRTLIVRAALRANLEKIVTGTRILRHTAATRMLRRGASMKEVADVLRHRCLDTTAIYAKVDLPRLAAVAVPWPEDLP